jgi:copper transport protein
MKKFRWLFALILAAGLVSVWFLPVQAHAMLLWTVPKANASLTASPPQIDLHFSEAITQKLSRIQVMDANGRQVNVDGVHLDQADPAHLWVGLPHLADGVYEVVWKVISATDGHLTSGSFPFAVGNVTAEVLASVAARTGDSNTPPPIAEMVVKGILYLAASSLLGSIIFTYLAWVPSVRKAEILEEDVQVYGRFSKRLTLAAILTLAVANLLLLMLQVGLAKGTLVAWPWQPEFLQVVGGTRLGTIGILRFEAVAVLAWLLLARKNHWNRWAGLGVCLFLLLTFSLESHAAGNTRPFLPVLADWIHLTAVSVWVGGLFSFLGGMVLIQRLAPKPRTVLTSLLIPHFTTLAMTSVGALGLTGIYSSFRDVGHMTALWTTPYGLALIIKLAVAAPMLALGGINFLFTTPNMRRAAKLPDGSPLLVNRFRYKLAGEVVLGIAILLWVGAFTSLPPATAGAIPAGFSQTAQADDLTVLLRIDPARPGMNTFTVTLTSAGKPVINAANVSLEFTSLTGMVPPAKAAMTDLGKGQFSLAGGYLGMPDSWDIKVVVIRPGKFDAYADFKLDLSGVSEAMP